MDGKICVEFDEVDLIKLLNRNIDVYFKTYRDETDFNFIVGWLVGIAFWYFEPLLEEQDSLKLLKAAYNSDRGNSLFKWAIRQALGLTMDEISNLELDIELRYDQFFNYSPLVKEYFLDIIHTG